MNRFVVGFAAFLLTVAVYAGTGNNSKTGNPGGGSVTSVGVTSTGGTLTVTGSPVTSSGSINVDISNPLPVGFSSSGTGQNFNNTGANPITSGVWSKVTGSTLSSNTRNFNFGVSYSPNINLPNDTRGDTVANIGWNVKGDATREDTSDSAVRIGFEDHYLQGGTGTPANEVHISEIDTSGTEHRVFTSYLPKNGGSGSSVAVGADVFNVNNYAGTQLIKFDGSAKVISFPNGDYQLQLANNQQDLKQKNAAGSAFITLIYDDSDDRVRIPQNFAAVNTTPTTGTYANQFAVFQATSTCSGCYVLRVNGAALTGTYNIAQFDGSASTGLVFIEKNTNATSTADMEHDISVASAGGNPFVKYIATGGTSWYVGQLHSDGSFRWNTTTLGSSDKMRLGSDGGLTLGAPTGSDEGAGTINTAGNVFVNGTSIVPLSGTTGSIGGGALTAGTCASGTATVTGATTSMAIAVTPVTYPGDGAEWQGYVSGTNTVTVKVCALVAVTPTASTYNVRAIP